MLPLFLPRKYWDRELEIEAQKWANHCMFEHNSLEDRKVKRFEVGQNLGLTRSTGIPDKNIKPDFKTVVKLWFSENEKFKFGQPGGIKKIGHYTQVIWSDTYLIGCAYIYYKKGEESNQLYVCNYGPRGNVYKDKPYLMPYEIGKRRCSHYGLLNSKTYKGLCAVKHRNPGRCTNGFDTRRSLTMQKESPKKKKKSLNKKIKPLNKKKRSAKTQEVFPKQEEESLKPIKKSLIKKKKSTKTEKESTKITENPPKKKKESLNIQGESPEKGEETPKKKEPMKKKKESPNQEKVITENLNNSLKMPKTVDKAVYYNKIPKKFIKQILDYAKMPKKVKSLYYYILINSVKSSNIII